MGTKESKRLKRNTDEILRSSRVKTRWSVLQKKNTKKKRILRRELESKEKGKSTSFVTFRRINWLSPEQIQRTG